MTYTTDKKTQYMPPGMRLTATEIKVNTGIHAKATKSYQYNAAGSLMKEYKSLTLAAKENGSSRDSLSYAIKKKTKSKGTYWSYEKKKVGH